MSWPASVAVILSGPAWALAAAWLLERIAPRAAAWLLEVLSEQPSE